MADDRVCGRNLHGSAHGRRLWFDLQSGRTRERCVGITLEQCDEASVIRLEGVIDIAYAAELKAALVGVFQPGKRVRIALDANADLDVTAIQLLWAAEREARASDVEFALAGPAPAPVIAQVKEAGFERFPVSVEPGR